MADVGFNFSVFVSLGVLSLADFLLPFIHRSNFISNGPDYTVFKQNDSRSKLADDESSFVVNNK